MAGIPLDWLIQVNSTGVRDKFSLSKLPTLAITKNNDIPNERLQKFFDSTSVGKKFGYNSTIKKFSDNYFSFTSKKASRADILYIFNYNEEPTPASVIGAPAKDIQYLKISGGFDLTLNDVTKTIQVNLNDVVSYSDVAIKLQESINNAGFIKGKKAITSHQNNTALSVDIPKDEENNIILDIQTSALDFEFNVSDSDVISFDKDKKELTGLKVGNATLLLVASEEGLNTVRIALNVDVKDNDDNSGFILEIQKSDLEVLNAVFTVVTNSLNYDVNVSDSTLATFNKDTLTLTPLNNGSLDLAFTFEFNEQFEFIKTFTIKIENNTISEVVAVNEDLNEDDSYIQQFFNAKVTYNQQTRGFILNNGLSGVDSSISFFNPPSSGIDIHLEFGLVEQQGAVKINGYNAINGINELLNMIEEDNGGYYVLQFDSELNYNDTLEFAKFIDNSNDRYLGIINTQDKKIISQDNALIHLQTFNGILVEYSKDSSPLGFSAGIISALDFSQLGGNINIAFNDALKFDDIALSTKEELNYLEINKSNSILRFSQIGQSTTWYGMGNILGTKTNNANIYIANSFLKFSLQLSLANMFDSQGLIGLRGSDNETLIIAYLENVFISCVRAGIIVEGANLTNNEKQVIISTFGNFGESAITQIERSGYFFKIETVDVAKQTLTIASAYVANKPVKQIVINNYILGA